MSSGSNSNEDRVMELADEFVLRRQAGEYPAISEYCEKYPGLASEIQELFPTLIFLEGTKISGTGSEAVAIKKIGEYELVREIGRGGMGIVYEARHEALGRRVAVKLLPSRFSDDRKALARFQREARAISSLHHTNIVPLFEAGVDDSHCYFAMQLIFGTSLDQAVASAKSSLALSHAKSQANSESGSGKVGQSETNRRLATLRALFESVDSKAGSSSTTNSRSVFGWVADIGAQIADALHYAHSQKIIHRDVKPSNILIDQNRNAWLSDFGLAKLEGEDLTQTGDIVGTLRYMSPERFKGQCDERADIYGLGLTLYEIVAMQPAYRSSDRVSLIDQICNSRVHRLRDLNPRLPADLETIVVKACAPEPSARYQTAAEFAGDLRNFIADRPIRARRANPFEKIWRWSRRNRSVAAAIAFAATSLALLAIFSTANSIRERGLRFDAETARKESEERGRQLQLQKAELQTRGEKLESQKLELEERGEILKKQSDTLQRNLYYAQMNLASAATMKPTGAETIKARLKSTHPDVLGKDLRGWEWYYLSSLVNQEESIWNERHWTFQVSYSPDGARIAYTVNGYGVVIRCTENGQLIRVIETNGARAVEWSPDGKSIASSDYVGNVFVWDAETYEKKLSIRAIENKTVHQLTWSHDSSQLASYAKDEYAIEIWDAATGDSVRKIEVPFGIEIITWSPVENYLAATISTDGGRSVWVYDTEDGSVDAKLNSSSVHLIGTCWSPDGNWLATNEYYDDADEGSPTRIWDWRKEKVVAEGPRGSGVSIAMRPGHDQILFPSDKGIVLWDFVSEQIVRKFYGHPVVTDLAWSPDGKRFASTGWDHTTRIWEVESRAPFREAISGGRNDDLDWDPTGRYLIGNSAKNFLTLWDTQVARSVSEENQTGKKEARSVSEENQSVTKDENKPSLTHRATNKTNDLKNSIQDSSGTSMVHELGEKPGPYSNSEQSSSKELTWKYIADKNDLEPNRVWAIAVNKQDGRIAFGGAGPNVSVWNRSTDKIRIYDGDVGEIWATQWSSDGRLAAICWPPYYNRETKTARPKRVNNLVVWDQEGRIMAGPKSIHGGFGKGLAWHPDGNKVATAAMDNAIRVWEPHSLDLLLEIPMPEGHQFFQNSELRYSPDGSRLASANRNALFIFDADSGEVLQKMDEVSGDFNSIDWSPDGKLLAAGTSYKATVWDTTNGRIAIQFDIGTQQIRWAPDGRRLGLSAYQYLRVLDATSGYEIAGETPTTEIAVDPPSLEKPEDAASVDPASPSKPQFQRSPTAAIMMSDHWTWSKPARLPNTANSSDNEHEPFVTVDGSELYFNSDRPGGVGEFDLYVCRRDSVDGEWGPAENLGDEINTPANDEGAFVTADGLSMYFNSDWTGDMDIYVSCRDSKVDAWGQPESLPTPINSSSNDAEPTLSQDGLTLVFVSTRANKFDLFIAQRESLDSEWSSLRIPRGMNTANWQGAPSILADETSSMLIYHSSEGLKIASRSGSGEPFLISEPLTGTAELGNAYAPQLWSDGRTLYYRRRDAETGKFNIWMSKRIKKSAAGN